MVSARVFGLLALLVACGSKAPPPANSASPALQDATKHTTRMVEVATGVALEVIDYGGTGEPVVFLAGLGNTGHVFDDFAPALTDRHRVVAITRRGFGASKTSAEGHDAVTRATDDLKVLDALGLQRVVLAGHSIAGDELSEIGTNHPDRVSGLIYLDAVHDHSKIPALLEGAPPEPQPNPASMASVAAFRAELARTQGIEFPMGESVAQLDVGDKGEVRGFKADPKAFAAIIAGTKSYDLTKITVRALVLLATETTMDMLFKDLDDKQRAAAEAWWPKFQAMGAETVANAKTNFKTARVVELPKANHYVFISDRARVLEEIRAFLAH